MLLINIFNVTEEIIITRFVIFLIHIIDDIYLVIK